MEELLDNSSTTITYIVFKSHKNLTNHLFRNNQTKNQQQLEIGESSTKIKSSTSVLTPIQIHQ